MYVETRAVVLWGVKHSDNERIVWLYTEQLGRIATVVRPSKRKGGNGMSAAYFGLLTRLEVGLDYRENKGLQHLKTCRVEEDCMGMWTDEVKQSTGYFVADVLKTLLREPQSDERLFGFVWETLSHLDRMETGKANFHLVFLMQLSKYMGFEPYGEDGSGIFDLREGRFVGRMPYHTDILTGEECRIFGQLREMSYEKTADIRMGRDMRRRMTGRLLEYISLHAEDVRHLQSLDVLGDLFD